MGTQWTSLGSEMRYCAKAMHVFACDALRYQRLYLICVQAQKSKTRHATSCKKKKKVRGLRTVTNLPARFSHPNMTFTSYFPSPSPATSLNCFTGLPKPCLRPGPKPPHCCQGERFESTLSHRFSTATSFKS